MSSDLGTIFDDAAKDMAEGGEKAGKAIEEHLSSIGQDLKHSGENYGNVEKDAEKSMKDIANGGEQEAEGATKDVSELKSGTSKAAGDGEQGTPLAGSGDPVSDARTPSAPDSTDDPVDLVTGEMYLPQQDVVLPGVLSLPLVRMHRSGYEHGRLFGRRWASTLDQRIEVDANGVHYAASDGRVLHYSVPTQPGQMVLPSEGARWPLRYDRGEDTYFIEQPEAELTLCFPRGPIPEQARLLRSVVDRNSNRATIEYDADGIPTDVYHSGGYHLRIGSIDTRDGLRVSDLSLVDAQGGPDTQILRFDYDLAGRLTGTVNSSGMPLVFEYDDDDRITAWVDRNGYRYDYRYRADGRVEQAVGDGGFLSANIDYDLESRVTRLTDAVGAVTEHHYDERGQVFKRVDAVGGVTLIERDRHANVVATTDPLGRVARIERDENTDPIRITRPDGTVVAIEYNVLRQPTSVTGPDGASWRYDYDEHGNLTQEIDPAGAVTAYAYDAHGGLMQITDPLGAITSITCNPAGLPLATVDPLGAAASVARDGFGRVTVATDRAGAETRVTWNLEGKPIGRLLPDGSRESWEYDAEGNLLAHTGPAGGVTTFEYGPFDVATKRTDTDGAVYRFAFDRQLRLTTVTNPAGLSWTYTYDPRGELVGESDFNGASHAYELDGAGQLSAHVNALGERIEFRRDALGRPVTRGLFDGVEHSYAHDAAGQLMRAETPGVVLEYTRDQLGRVLTETVNGRTLTNTYNAAGRRVTRTTPDGVVSQWAYDAAGNPTQLSGTAGQLAYQYDAAGRETYRALGPAAVLTQAFDAVGRLANQEIWAYDQVGPADAQPTARSLQSRTYAYRADGTPLEITDALRGTRRFDLNPVGRVTAVNAATWRETYAYDSLGNLTRAEHPGQDPDTAAAREHQGTMIRRAGRTRYEYDQAGRLTQQTRRTLSGQEKTWTYAWDSENRLTLATNPAGETWEYAYDGLGRRVAKARLAQDGQALDTVWFTWDGTQLAEQTTTLSDGRSTALTWDYQPGTYTPAAQTRRTWATDAPQPQIDQEFHAIVTDLVGTPTELITPAGQLAWRTAGTLWGRATPVAGSTADCPLRQPGQYHDPETGLHYNCQRYYDPDTGSYLTPDLLGLDPAPNHHGYVSNPLIDFDPLGLAPTCVKAATHDELSDLATAPYKKAKVDPKTGEIVSGQSNAGRALQKHADPTRGASASKFPSASTDAERTSIGNAKIKELLSDPGTTETISDSASAHYGTVTRDLWHPTDGWGARWSMRGGTPTFEGFLSS